MKVDLFQLDNQAGWKLDIKRFYTPDALNPARRPIVMIPGYCMNTFILSYHPRGTSMVSYLTNEGFEVWTANLRGQGDSRAINGVQNYGFRELALVDFPVVRDFVLNNTQTETQKLDAVGCSLGATVLYAYLAHHPEEHQVGSLVSVGGPLRWNRIHPLMRVALSSPTLAGSVRLKGTRQIAEAVLPVVQKAPFLLSFYMNPDLIDLSAANKIVKTIDDPHGHLTRQISHWLRQRDLVVGGLNISEALANIDVPLMCILANADGIVPPESALSIIDHIGSRSVEVLKVGTRKTRYAHADLFIAHDAEQEVFAPLGNWLTKQYT